MFFCCALFSSTTKLSAIEQAFEHETKCPRRPENLCGHCGRGFSRPKGCGESSDAAIRMHNIVCSQNPSNQSWCPYCGRHFKSTFDSSAVAQCQSHIENCSENPSNQCQLCDLRFGGDPNSPDPMDHAAAKKMQHEFFVHGLKTKRNHRYKDKDKNRHSHKSPRCLQTVLAIREESRSLDEGIEFASSEMREQMILDRIRVAKRNILAIIRPIEDVSCLRLELRKLQMVWHPDKKRESVVSERIQREVFDFVMKCWQRYLSVIS